MYPSSDEKSQGAEFSAAEWAAINGVSRMAFPDFKVFIFYEDVTSDVVDVRVNQAGGSAERTPGSVSITLANPQDKYILSHADTFIIGAGRAKMNGRMDRIIRDADILLNERGVIDKFRFLMSELEYWVATGNMEGTEAYLRECNLNPDDFLVKVEGGESYYMVNEGAMRAAILEKGLQEVDLDTTEVSSNWLDEAAFSSFVKGRVLKKKLVPKTEIKPKTNTYLIEYDKRIVFDYLFYEGDCIFQPNDPIRVAFRDPFDPRVWYWMFSGFVDSWTENSGANTDSLVTITGTDVTKVVRYTTVKPPELVGDKSDDIETDTTGDVGLIAYRELFANYTMFEILEVLFFGASSVEKGLHSLIQNELAHMSETTAMDYLIQNFNMTKVDADAYFAEPKSILGLSRYLTEEGYNKIFEHKKGDKLGTLSQLKDIGIISHPQGTKFRRKNSLWGVEAYFLGTPNEDDAKLGSGLKNLKEWNDIVHHRVRRSDLQDMAADGLGVLRNYESDVSMQLPEGQYASILEVIDIIGKNEQELYPVGAGRVFYVTSADWGKFDRSIIDKSFGGTIAPHSEYRDKLSFIYDLAERVEHCFYATPKGDVVFEMPLYDFDPSEFASDQGVEDHDFDKKALLNDYRTLFKQVYDGDYSAGDFAKLTEMSLELNLKGSNFEVFDYDKIPSFNYLDYFTVEEHEQYGFSNSCSDQGVYTMIRVGRKVVPAQDEFNEALKDSIKREVVTLDELIPSLGLRVHDAEVLGFISDAATAEAYGAVLLNRINAEAKNISVPTIPKFGLMVNRPLRWRKRNRVANIANLQHSIVWNSSCETTINMNQVRCWTGESDPETGLPIMEHFGGKRPYELARLINPVKGNPKDKKSGAK